MHRGIAVARVSAVVPVFLGVLALTALTALPALASPSPHTLPARVGTGAAMVLDVTSGDPVDADAGGDLDVGDQITYTFTITNTGGQPIRGIAIDDPLTGPADCPAYADLDPGQLLVCHETYAITQLDLDTGTVDNRAVAHGLADDGSTVVSPPDTTSTTLAAVAGLALVKDSEAPTDANASGRIDAGDQVTFDYTVTNTGDLTLSDVGIDDPAVKQVTCPTADLPPGSTTSCTAQHLLSQADIDAGTLTADAVATAVSPGNSTVDSPTATSTTVVPGYPSLTLVLRARLIDQDGDALADVGEQVGYTFVVSNTGSTTVRDIVVGDAALKAAGDPVRCPVTTLNVGETVTCAAVHTVTAADVAAPLVNRANVRAVGGAMVTSPFFSVTVPVDASGAARPRATGPDVGWVVGGGLAALVLVGAGGVALRARRSRARRSATSGRGARHPMAPRA